MTAVSVENITKRYGKTVALDGVSFEVEKGELFGIMRPTVPARPPSSASSPP